VTLFRSGVKPLPVWSLIFLILSALAALAPIVWMTVNAFKLDDEINLIPPTFFPHAFTLDNFFQIFTQFHFLVLTYNSIIVSISVVVLSLVLGGSAAYGFSRHPFFGSTALFSAVLVTRMVTPASFVLPLYLLMSRLHLTNSLVALVVGITVLNLPFVIWILKPFFDSLPREIEEAAQLDGVGPIGIFWRFAIPLAGPAFKTVALFSFIAAWTDLLIPITMATRPDAWTLTAGVVQMQTGFKIYWGALMAGGLYLTLPSFAIAIAMQKSLTRGIRTTF
jgi:ABC-type glycerol-3-phosphate transport system permease component